MPLSCRTITKWGRNSYLRRTTGPFSTTTSEIHPNESHMLDYIPKPTWSIRSLNLNSTQDKLPREEMERLSRLALLDVKQLPDDLEQDLANMMHMVQQVSDFVAANPELFEDYDDSTGVSTYDFVRGVTAAPLRGVTTEREELGLHEEKEAARVWESYLEPNTVRQGGAHKYFSITTKSE